MQLEDWLSLESSRCRSNLYNNLETLLNSFIVSASLQFSFNVFSRLVHDDVTKNPPGFRSFIPRKLISLYPAIAFSIVSLLLVNAGGSSITTSYCLPSLPHFFNTSNALAASNLQIESKLFNSAFLFACCTAFSEISIPKTDLAP